MNFDIARELKAIRIRNNLRMKDVANDNKMALETLRRYEKNAENLPIKILEKLLDYYKVNHYIFFKNVCEYTHEKKEE